MKIGELHTLRNDYRTDVIESLKSLYQWMQFVRTLKCMKPTGGSIYVRLEGNRCVIDDFGLDVSFYYLTEQAKNGAVAVALDFIYEEAPISVMVYFDTWTIRLVTRWDEQDRILKLAELLKLDQPA